MKLPGISLLSQCNDINIFISLNNVLQTLILSTFKRKAIAAFGKIKIEPFYLHWSCSPLRREQSKGSNSNAGKMDRTWSKIWSQNRIRLDEWNIKNICLEYALLHKVQIDRNDFIHAIRADFHWIVYLPQLSSVPVVGVGQESYWQCPPSVLFLSDAVSYSWWLC